jgi:hypothetical protein
MYIFCIGFEVVVDVDVSEEHVPSIFKVKG